jgi:hypothetical protein
MEIFYSLEKRNIKIQLTYVRKFIKARKELIKDFDELRGRVGGRDGGEADDVCVQNAAIVGTR